MKTIQRLLVGVLAVALLIGSVSGLSIAAENAITLEALYFTDTAGAVVLQPQGAATVYPNVCVTYPESGTLGGTVTVESFGADGALLGTHVFDAAAATVVHSETFKGEVRAVLRGTATLIAPTAAAVRATLGDSTALLDPASDADAYVGELLFPEPFNTMMAGKFTVSREDGVREYTTTMNADSFHDWSAATEIFLSTKVNYAASDVKARLGTEKDAPITARNFVTHYKAGDYKAADGSVQNSFIFTLVDDFYSGSNDAFATNVHGIPLNNSQYNANLKLGADVYIDALIRSGSPSGFTWMGSIKTQNDPDIVQKWTLTEGYQNVYNTKQSSWQHTPTVITLFNFAAADENGIPQPYVFVDTVAEVEATPGTFTQLADDLATVYCHPRQGENVADIALQWEDNFLAGIRHATACSKQTIVFENIGFMPRTTDHINNQFGGGDYNKAVFAYLGCKFTGGINNTISLIGKYEAYLNNCVAAYGFRDNFSYHSDVVNGEGSKVIEINCRSYGNGDFNRINGCPALSADTANANNASTAHDSMCVLRVGGRYTDSQGHHVGDTATKMSLNIGCEAYNILTSPSHAVAFSFKTAPTAWVVDSYATGTRLRYGVQSGESNTTVLGNRGRTVAGLVDYDTVYTLPTLTWEQVARGVWNSGDALKTVQSIALSGMKTEYAAGDSLDRTQGKVTVTFADGSQTVMAMAYTAIAVDGFDTASGGEKQVTVRYGGKSATYTVTVGGAPAGGGDGGEGEEEDPDDKEDVEEVTAGVTVEALYFTDNAGVVVLQPQTKAAVYPNVCVTYPAGAALKGKITVELQDENGALLGTHVFSATEATVLHSEEFDGEMRAVLRGTAMLVPSAVEVRATMGNSTALLDPASDADAYVGEMIFPEPFNTMMAGKFTVSREDGVREYTTTMNADSFHDWSAATEIFLSTKVNYAASDVKARLGTEKDAPITARNFVTHYKAGDYKAADGSVQNSFIFTLVDDFYSGSNDAFATNVHGIPLNNSQYNANLKLGADVYIDALIRSGSPSGFTWMGSIKTQNDPDIVQKWAPLTGYNKVYTTKQSAWAHTPKVITLFNFAAADENGIPQPYVFVDTVAEVEATPGTFTQLSDDLATVYCHPRSGENVADIALQWEDNFLAGIRHESACSKQTIVFENIGFMPRVSDHINNQFGGGDFDKAVFAFLDCKFTGGINNALSLIGKYEAYLNDCVAAYGFRDNFNYHSAAPNGEGSRVIEINCRSYGNGDFNRINGCPALSADTANANNASTAHDNMYILRVGGRYTDSQGHHVGDTATNMSLNIGCEAYNILTSPSHAVAYSFKTQPTAWVVDCYATGTRLRYGIQSGESNTTVLGNRGRTVAGLVDHSTVYTLPTLTWEQVARGVWNSGDAPKEVQSIALSGMKTEYAAGDSLDRTQGKVTVTFTDGSKTVMAMAYTAIAVDGFDTASGGEKQVTVRYGGKSATYTVTVEGGAEPTAAIIDGRYYENGVKVPYAGLVQVDGNYYYVNHNAKVVTGRFFASRFNDFTQFKNGYYYFDENGVMNTKAAVYDGYYYADGGKCLFYAGLVEVDGDYYYVLKDGEVKRGRYAIVKHNDLVPKGIYSFGTDGKMLKNTVENGFYYPENGLSTSYLGLVKAADGNLYYVQAQGKVVRDNASFFVSNTNGLVAKGRYAFDANGAMII